MLKRFRCYLLGCTLDYICRRCGADLYDQDRSFHSPCWLVDVIQNRWVLLRRFAERFIGRRCDVCGKRYWGGDYYTCCNECDDKWVPF